MPLPTLPIEPDLPLVVQSLGDRGAAVLQAPPGAGKTTLVPLALLHAPWLAGGRILLLEPRRVAARAAARRMAALLGEEAGGTVGYRIRRESRVGARTRIEVVTEGILTRMVQGDPSLEGVGVVIFDEFHERSLHADLGLALTLQARAVLRPDLRVLVMSATLDGGPVAALLGGAPVISSEGRSFPVETRYLPPPQPGPAMEAAVAAAVRRALDEDEGDVLAFLPGAGEIRRTAERLEGVSARILPLHGALTGEAQDAAINPDPAGGRKVVLATAIAETSLTIEGVRVVVDSGYARVPRYSPRSGMTRLATVRVSRASADQRRGRAGRTAPGVCYRLWAAAEEGGFLPRATPEMLEADLAPLALELAAAGVADPSSLAWLDPPPVAALAEARSLLVQLGALDRTGQITTEGRRMAELGTHPRLAHLLLHGSALGAAPLAADLAALLEERDLLRGAGGPPDADLTLRLDLLRMADIPSFLHGASVDRGTLHRVRAEAREWRRHMAREPGAAGAAPPSAGVLLALAYPDRVAQRRKGQAGRFLLRNGLGVVTDSPALITADYLVAADVEGDRREGRVRLGAALTLAEVLAHVGGQVEPGEVVAWDEQEECVVAVRRERLGSLTLSEVPLRAPDPALVTGALLGWIRRAGLEALPWTAEARRVRERLAFLHRLAALTPAWPDVSDEALLNGLEAWLAPVATGCRRRSDFDRVDLGEALMSLPGPARRQELHRLAPAHLEVPSGSRIAVEYGEPSGPFLAVRLQEVFGLTETPRVAGGLVPVTLHLLSPAGRPVQVTRDLAGFWRSSYRDVRKEMKGRYPKHDWPEDPLRATPTRRTGRRRTGG